MSSSLIPLMTNDTTNDLVDMVRKLGEESSSSGVVLVLDHDSKLQDPSPMPYCSFIMRRGPVAECSVSRFHTTGPEFCPRSGQGRLSFSSLQWVDK
ncbi:hypothetical protein TNCV_5117591 [Trichonephila clavipes]|nr:hypothetical protein TNCV_5117591 [Trichonephila clavipes]